MQSSAATEDLRPPSLKLNEPKMVRAILLVVGLLLAAVGAYLLATAEARLNAEIEAEIEMPLAEFRQLPAEVTSIVEEARSSDLLKRRAAFGSVLGAGVLMLLLALIVRRRLLGAVITAFVILAITAGAFAVLAKKKRDVDAGGQLEPEARELRTEKIAVWCCIGFTAASLAWAGKIAVGYRRRIASTAAASTP